MKNLYFLFLLCSLFFSSCASMTPPTAPPIPPKNTEKKDALPKEDKTSQSVFLIQNYKDIMNSFDLLFKEKQRDIDNATWLESYINYMASKDQLTVDYLRINLYTFQGDSREKEQFIEQINRSLKTLRQEYSKEIGYLITNSLLLKNLPWIDRDIYGEKTEFNYWYLLFQMEKINRELIEDQVLPYMLALIPQDKIFPLSYLWLKNPESLNSMDKEIGESSYPWNLIVFLKELNRELIEETNPPNPSVLY